MKELNLDNGMKIGYSLGGGNIAKGEKGESSNTARFVFEEEEDEKNRRKKNDSKEIIGTKNALEELMREEEKAKERSNRKDYWVREWITVKVVNKALAQKGYCKRKGVVRKVIHRCVGEIEMLESKHVLRVDQ